MCERKPGPRCSSHTHEAFRRALTNVDAIEDRLAGTSRGEHRNTMLAELHAAQVEVDGRARDYESSPAGQRELHAAITAIEDVYGSDGGRDAAALAALRSRLDAARATRERQQSDLVDAQEREARLAAATPDEQRFIKSAETRVTAADAAIEAARDRLAGEVAGHTAARDQTNARYAAAVSADAEADRIHGERMDQAAAVQAHAHRIYRAAGVEEPLATYYAQDVAENSTPIPPSGRYSYTYGKGEMVPQRAFVVHQVDHPDTREATAAAAAAALSDARFQAANAALVEGINRATEARLEGQRAWEGVGDLHDNPTAEHTRRLRAAREDYEQAVADREPAERAVSDARAMVAAGAGTTGTKMRLGEVGDEVVRQPDGTVNAYVYEDPSPGFPDGRYLQATGITTVHNRGYAFNGLQLPTGEVAYQAHRHTPGVRGRHTTIEGVHHVLITPPQAGAQALRSENSDLRHQGFSTSVDTSD